MNKVSIKAAVRDAKREDARYRKGLATGTQLNAVKNMDSFVNFQHKLGVGTDNVLTAGTYGFRAEVRGEDGAWHLAAEQAAGSDNRREREIATQPLAGGPLRIHVTPPPGGVAGIAEVRIVAVLKDR